MKSSEVNSGKYRFKITENIYERDGITFSRAFKIGGVKEDCIDIFIQYDRDGNAIGADMPSLKSFDKCSLDSNLDKGEGTRIMTTTLLKHVKKNMPEITYVKFQDSSNIECATEDQVKNRPRNLNPDSYIRPIPLYYFSMAFNGITWYEKHFNAHMRSHTHHENFHRELDRILNTPANIEDITHILRTANAHYQMSQETRDEINKYIENETTTYSILFHNIPTRERCYHSEKWIIAFIEKQIRHLYEKDDWVIDLDQYMSGGGTSRTRNRNNKKYYCPKGVRMTSRKQYGLNLNIDDI